MTFKSFVTLGMVGLALASTIPVSATIAPFSATYSLSYDGKSGTATRTLTKSGDGFVYKMSARAVGIASANQSATFKITNGRIVPSSATTSFKVAGIGNTHTMKFSNSQVVSTYKGKSQTLAMPKQAYDDLSLEMQIRQELLDGKFTGNYPLVKKTQIENAKFKKAGTSQIKTPAGTYETIRIDRLHDNIDNKARATSFWLAPSLNYLPVKVSQTESGKTMTMTLRKVD